MNDTVISRPTIASPSRARPKGLGQFPVKRLKDGRAALNLACGTKMDWSWNNVDFSPYARLRKHRLLASTLRKVGLLSSQRYQRLSDVDPAVIVWDLRRGIPFADNTFAIVYHSHFLEHLTRADATAFLVECFRVLEPGGVLRIVVPDLQSLVLYYQEAIRDLENNEMAATARHEHWIAELFDQMVRTNVTGTTEQKPWVRAIERFLRSNAADAGELHRWMYDQYSLGRLLTGVSFLEVRRESAHTSRIREWQSVNLDLDEKGGAYKPYSLYMEAAK